MVKMMRTIVQSLHFEYFIITLILINALVISLETIPSVVADYQFWLTLVNHVVLGVFAIEIVMKMIALSPAPLRYFKDGWNCFDFTVVVLCLIPASGSFATLARLVRLLRVVRLISVFPELRLIVDTLIRTVPSMAHVALLMGLIFFIYGVAGYHLFHDIDPEHWRNLPVSLLTLFRIVTLEDWTDVMYAAMQAKPWAWIYFISFVVVGTFVVVNLFIAIVLNNLDEAKAEKLRQLQSPPTAQQMMKELQDTQMALQRLQRQLELGVSPVSDAVSGTDGQVRQQDAANAQDSKLAAD